MGVRSRVIHGDCREVMRGMGDGSVDAIVTDPPYGLGFMGKEWDTPGAMVERKPDRSVRWDKVGGNHNPTDAADAARTRRAEGRKFQAWCETWAREAYRVLRPGGHFLAFGGSRTYHRLACAIEDAGFEIRDQVVNFHDGTRDERAFLDSLSEEQRRALAAVVDERSPLGQLFWIYGQGFPKSRDVSKAIDAEAGAAREVIGFDAVKFRPNRDKHLLAGQPGGGGKLKADNGATITAPATDAARRWQGFGTALKPAHEPIVLARKPIAEKSVAANVVAFGTGALNIDGCRISVEAADRALIDKRSGAGSPAEGWGHIGKRERGEKYKSHAEGRWPANVIWSQSPVEYEMKRDLSLGALAEVYKWLHENTER
jgi:hypothetical protein